MKVLKRSPVVSDAQLLDRFDLHGDGAAFDELFARHAPMVERIALRICGCPSDADDVTQQVFIALAGRAGQLKLRGSIAGWLFKSAWNFAMRKLRDDALRERKERLAATVDQTASPPIERCEDWEIACEEILKLDDGYRDVIVLHYIHGMSVSEIADVLGKPRGTVASQLVRGRSLLQGRLEDRKIVLSAGLIALLQVADRPAKGGAVLAGDLAMAAGADSMAGFLKIAAVWGGLTLTAAGTAAGMGMYAIGIQGRTTASFVYDGSLSTSAASEGRAAGGEAKRTSDSTPSGMVPEPGTIALIGAAAGLLMTRVRKGGRT